VISDAVLAAYDALVATVAGVERKGVTLPYTAINGNMSSFLTPEGTLALRLSTADRETFGHRYRSEPVVQHGAVMKEYVAVPADLLQRLDELAPWFERSCEYVGSLKPKKTSR
jgi:TfoX/Sxy family transcriptional regulator of competence genes